MGTSGLWGYVHGEKFYVFWNQYDSDKLDDTLAAGVPRNPHEYQAWLKEKRSDCEALRQRLEKTRIIPLPVTGETKLLREIAGAEDLYLTPGYVRPRNELFVEHTVMVNLDRNILDCDEICCFHLDQLPQAIAPFLEAANRYSLGLDTKPEVACITTKALPTPTTVDAESIHCQYLALKPRFLASMKRENRRAKAAAALVSSMSKIYTLASQFYNVAFTQARDTSEPGLKLFQEVSWLIVCMASCSPSHIGLADAEELGWPADRAKRVSMASIFKYGILGNEGDARPQELVSSFLGDFHEDRKTPGSAPSSPWFWVGSVLVWLTRDLVSRSSFEAAICAAVAKGRAEGKRNFQLLVFSIRHYVVAYGRPSLVLHSKRYGLWTKPAVAEVSYLENPQPKDFDDMFRRPKEIEESINYGNTSDAAWVSDKRASGFETLAHFFLAAITPHLETKPSRALGKFGIDRHFTIVDQLRGEPGLMQFPDEDEIRGRHLFPQLTRSEDNQGQVHCILIVRASSSSGTPSMLTVPVLWNPWDSPQRVTKFNYAAESARSRVSDGLTEADLYRFKTMYFGQNWYHYEPRWRQPFEDKGIDWELLGEGLSPPLRRITLSARGLAILYALIFFIPMGIGGCEPVSSLYIGGLDEVNRALIPRQRLGTHLYIAKRQLRGPVERSSVYFIALFRPVTEDTPEGWRQAVADAEKQAELEYFREAFALWINRDKTDKHDFAIFVVIGTKFMLLHVTSHPQLPTMMEVSPDPAFDLRHAEVWWFRKPPWQCCERMKPYLREARAKLKFDHVDVSGIKANKEPLNAQSSKDRPAIEEALKWARQLADSRGKQETEGKAGWDMYDIWANP